MKLSGVNTNGLTFRVIKINCLGGMKQILTLNMLLFLIFSCGGGKSVEAPANDQLLYEASDSIMAVEVLRKFSLGEKPEPGILVRDIALHFLGTPYVAHTLENGADEKMVINLREMDCTTFAENCLALARTASMKKPSFAKFAEQLEKIRYRGGIRHGYGSRLHYFSDWIYDNDHKKMVKSISQEMAHMMVPNQVNFMSTHPDSYPVLKGNEELIAELTTLEKEISGRMTWFIPRDQMAEAERQILDGDIIGITSGIEGLDVSHVVIAIHQGRSLHFIHASSRENKVVVSDQSLRQYLDSSKMATGIMVARPL